MSTAFSGRREDARLVTGAGRYTADWSLPGAARAAFLRSDMAHARIVRLDVAAAEAAPGVLAVLTGADMAAAGYNRGTPHLPAKGRDGPLKAPVRPALATGKVRYVGDPLAIVVAETEAQAKDAVELIDLELESLPVSSDPADALAPGAALIDDGVPGNLAFDGDYGDAEATEAAFAIAAHVARVELESARVVAAPMEPKAAMAAWDGAVLDLWCPTQGNFGLRDRMAAYCGLPAENVHIHAEDVGGAFGVRGDAYPEYQALALAARRVGRPVKWLGSRSETFVSDFMGRSLRMVAEMALDAEGHFLAIRHDWIADVGAYPSGAGPLTAVMNSTTMAFGAYRIGAVAGRNRLVLTNRVPITAYRGAARPEMAYAVERLVDEAARVTGIDRVEIRRRNMLKTGDFPREIPAAMLPASYDSGDFARLLDRALEVADWAGFEARRNAAADRGRLRGIGLALFIEPAGGVSPTDQTAVVFTAEGIRLYQSAQASGQGHETVFPEIVGRSLGIAPDRITMAFQTPDSPARRGGGAFGSRSLMSQGSGFEAAAEEVIARGRKLAAEALGVAEAALDYAEGSYAVPGTNRFIGLEDLAKANPGALDTVAELPSPRNFPSGCHVAEVEIDPETGVTELASYVSVDDCGTVVNETLVKGQIWGGLVQGLGQVFGEIAAYDAEGQLLAGSFMDYAMPRADMVRNVTILLEATPSPTNRLGAKGVGEAGTVGSLPTVMNAMLDALRPAGVTALDMPASPGRVWEALRVAG